MSPDELRALVREAIREQLGQIRLTDAVETVVLRTDADVAAFVHRLLEMDDAEQAEVRSGRKSFRLASPPPPPPPAPALPLGECNGLHERASTPSRSPQAAGAPARRVERGAVTERMVRDAARAGERLVLGRAAVLTPLAADRARSSGVQIDKEH